MTEDNATAAAFDTRLREVMEAYGRPPLTQHALRGWWQALAAFDLAAVLAALAEHVGTCKFPPTPADVVALILARDGRPGPEEAWSIALQSANEAETVVWTQEIAAARAVALPILAAGDEVGARKAFLEVYRRDVAEARRLLRPPLWQPSLGTDPTRRGLALCAAERCGRLSAEALKRLLSWDETGAAQGPAAVAGLLAGKVAELPPSRDRDCRRFIAAVRAGLAEGVEAAAARRDQRVAARRAQEQAAAAARQAREAMRAHRRLVLLRRAAAQRTAGAQRLPRRGAPAA